MESAKMLILNSKINQDFKAVLNLKVDSPSLIKFYNLANNNKNLALGIKHSKNIIKVPLKVKDNNCEFNLPKEVNLKDNLFCAVVDVTNAFCPEIVLSGSLNSEYENTTIESAFVTTKPQDVSLLYEDEKDEQIEALVDKNLQEDMNTTYYDNCAECKYRKAFYEGGTCCCNSEDKEKNNKTENINSLKNLSTVNKNIEMSNVNNSNLNSNIDALNNNNLQNSNKNINITKNDDNNQDLTQDNLNNISEPNSFYEQIKPQVDSLFNKYKSEEILEKIIPNSKWVKVEYDANANYYVMGLIYNEANVEVDYIAYGMPSNDSVNPPEDLKDYAQWLPIDINNKNSEGYWIVYQDAKTGETIKVTFVV